MLDSDKRTMLTESSTTLVNPNGRPWTVAYQGHVITFEPFEEVNVSATAADWLLIKAAQAYENSKVDAQDSYQQYLELSSKRSHAARMMAEKMLGSDGKLKAKAWDYPPVVKTDTSKGKEILKEAKKKFQSDNSEGIITDTGTEVELLVPKDDWDRDTLRDYISDHYGEWAPAAKEAVLLKQALRLYNLQKTTLMNAGKIIKET